MATIYRASAELTTGLDYDAMQTTINNYWGSALEEKVFSIMYWEIRQLLAASSEQEVALKIKDIDNRALVEGEWIPFEEDMEDLLADPANPNETYFVFDEDTLESIRSNINPLANPINTVSIWGRIGRSLPMGGDFQAFLIAVGGVIIPPDGSGGDGTGTGVKIPPLT